MTDKPLTPEERAKYDAIVGPHPSPEPYDANRDELVARVAAPSEDPGEEPTDAEKRAWRAGAEFAMPVADPSDGLTMRGHVPGACWCGDEHDDEPSDGTLARVAAPSDGHTHYPVTDVTGTVFSYTHLAPVCPYCAAAPSDGLTTDLAVAIGRYNGGRRAVWTFPFSPKNAARLAAELVALMPARVAAPSDGLREAPTLDELDDINPPADPGGLDDPCFACGLWRRYWTTWPGDHEHRALAATPTEDQS
jgi:hypothetical protein